jgi:hypothetical protein
MLLKPFNGCRRTAIAFYTITVLAILGFVNDIDVASPIASVAIALAAVNGVEKAYKEPRMKQKEDTEYVGNGPKNKKASS